jgi:hypothetical protein
MDMEPRLLLSLGSMVAGFIFGVGGMYLLATQKFMQTPGGIIEVKIPFFGRLKTNYPAAIFVFFGSFLVFYPLHLWHQTPETIPVIGKIEKIGQLSHEGIMVGIIPDRYKTFTNSDGSYTIEVDKQGHSYAAFAYYTNGSQYAFKIQGVKVSKDKGAFDCLMEIK